MNWNEALEALVRQSPEDDAVWAVLEDWTLEQGDVRARLVERVRVGDEKGVQTVRWALEAAAFESLGRRKLGIHSEWRAGYLVGCWLKARRGESAELLDFVLGLRCARLLTRLHADLDVPEDLSPLLEKLAQTSVRELALSTYWKPTLPVRFESSLLEPLAVERLRLMGRAMTLRHGRALERLTELWLTPGSPEDLRVLVDGPLPRLSELAVYGRTFEHRHGVKVEAFGPLLSGGATPALKRLYLREVDEVFQAAFLAALAESPLLPRLERFSFGYDALVLETVPASLRGAFAHLR